MQGMYGIKMEVNCKTDDVLAKLKTNREEHVGAVKDAREGYLKVAQKALDRKMAAVKEGKVVALHFDLMLPLDHTAEYDTVIRMLEMHTEETITLSADEVRCLIENKWEWMQQFLQTNQAYGSPEVYSPLWKKSGLSLGE